MNEKDKTSKWGSDNEDEGKGSGWKTPDEKEWKLEAVEKLENLESYKTEDKTTDVDWESVKQEYDLCALISVDLNILSPHDHLKIGKFINFFKYYGFDKVKVLS